MALERAFVVEATPGERAEVALGATPAALLGEQLLVPEAPQQLAVGFDGTGWGPGHSGPDCLAGAGRAWTAQE